MAPGKPMVFGAHPRIWSSCCLNPSYLVPAAACRYSKWSLSGWATISISPTTNFGSRSLTKRSAESLLSNSWFKRPTCSSVRLALHWRKDEASKYSRQPFLACPHIKHEPLSFLSAVRGPLDLDTLYLGLSTQAGLNSNA